MAFSDNLKKLPGISHLAAIELRDGEGKVLASFVRRLEE